MMSTILIIDDDDQLRKSFCKLLSEEGYTAEKALLRGKWVLKSFRANLQTWSSSMSGCRG